MNLDKLKFKKLNESNYSHLLVDRYGITYNPVKDSWHIKNGKGYPVPFYPETEEDIRAVRRLFKKPGNKL